MVAYATFSEHWTNHVRELLVERKKRNEKAFHSNLDITHRMSGSDVNVLLMWEKAYAQEMNGMRAANETDNIVNRNNAPVIIEKSAPHRHWMGPHRRVCICTYEIWRPFQMTADCRAKNGANNSWMAYKSNHKRHYQHLHSRERAQKRANYAVCKEGNG